MLAVAGFAFGPWVLDARTRSLTRDSGRVGLSPCEYEVLHLFVRRANVVVYAQDAIQAADMCLDAAMRGILANPASPIR